MYSILSLIILLLPLSHGLGITVQPIRAGDSSKYTSKENLLNCITYHTVMNDFIMIRIKVGEHIQSQLLNLKVFDDEDNELRSQPGLDKEVSFMFTNLNKGKVNNRVNYEGEPEPEGVQDLKRDYVDLSPREKLRTTLLHVCLDNLYYDKSWTFRPKPRDVEVHVSIKTPNTIKETNYDDFIQYFKKLQIEQDKHEVFHVTESDVDEQIEFLKAELNSVIDTLASSEQILKELMEQEWLLRDVNEEIYVKYTTRAVGVLICIGVFGVAQLIYFRFVFGKRI